GSLALALGAASAAGAVGLTVHDLNSAYARLRLENGLLHGCIGDYNRAREAEEHLEDAMIRAAIDLGLGVGLFAGMTAVQKIAELRRLSRMMRGLDDVAPTWMASTEAAAVASRRLARAERAAIAEEYGLSEIPGLTRANGRLTRDGRRATELIDELEQLGISRSRLREALRSCTR
ncbi:MAG: hypothetical protein IT285_11775, partial [Bdellovibrionales bacterium]|nr:hypothetical protein [Bdellovibrionales bacterium]